MAYSWTLVRRRWDERVDEYDDPDYIEAVAMTTALEPVLTAEERSVAVALAEECFAIAAAHGAIWV
jgi:hypothetical protein